MQKIQVQSITIIPAEGPLDMDFEPKTVSSWFEADGVLFDIAKYIDRDGGYNLKTDFVITFEDGEEYKGRYDIKSLRSEWPDLREHVRDFVSFSAGLWRPDHMDVKRWQEFLNATWKYSPREVWLNLARNYEVGVAYV